MFVRLDGRRAVEEQEMAMRAGVLVAVDMVTMPMQSNGVAGHPETP